jgi:cell division protein FtsB
LQSRLVIEQKKIAQHRAARDELNLEIEAIEEKINQLETGAPLESDRELEYSRNVRRQ